MDHRNIDVVLFSIFQWEGPYSSISIAMAKEFAKENRVFYINHPLTLKDYFSLPEHLDADVVRPQLRSGQVTYKNDPAFGDRLITVRPPLMIPVNFLPEGGIYNQLQKINERRMAHTLRHLLDTYGVKKYILINCFDPFYNIPIPKDHPPLLNIYQCVDDISQNEYTVKHGPRREDEQIAEADLTLVTSSELFRLKKDIARHINTLNNAADTKLFRTAIETTYERPSEIAKIDRPIIGYTGNLDHMRVDYRLLKKVAEGHPDKLLLLIGPINNEEYKEVGLDRMENVIFTGGKPIEQLPAYLQHMDCTLIPFHCNTLTRSIYPLKINEYLAAGKSVVSTRFSQDIEGFADLIYLADSDEQFVQRIDEAIADKSEEIIQKRLERAETNTWKARVAEFWKLVKDRSFTSVPKEVT